VKAEVYFLFSIFYNFLFSIFYFYLMLPLT